MLLKKVIKKFFPAFSPYTLTEKISHQRFSGFSILFRLDMDCIDSADRLESIYQNLKNLGIKATCFFLNDQLVRFKKELADKQDFMDVQYHSRSRPRFLMIDNCNLDKFLVRRKLSAEYKKISKIWPKITGHCEHGINNYLNMDYSVDQDIIEVATLGSGFKWIGGYRNIVGKINNEVFLNPAISYFIENKNDRVLVLNSSWEDRYFLKNWSQSKFNFPEHKVFVESAFKNILNLIMICREENLPCILNFHPHLWMKENKYGIGSEPLELLDKLSEHIKDNNLMVNTFSEIYNAKNK